jgi:hypothetical protein
MTDKKETLSLADIDLLREAIEEASSWRGAHMPEDHVIFDEGIARMYRALKAAVETRRQLEEIKAALSH